MAEEELKPLKLIGLDGQPVADVVGLRTAEGERVTEIKLPPLLTLPSVLIWGNRVFVRKEANWYDEAFAFWVRGLERCP